MTRYPNQRKAEPFTHRLKGLSPTDGMLVTLGRYRAEEVAWMKRELTQYRAQGYKNVRIEEMDEMVEAQ